VKLPGYGVTERDSLNTIALAAAPTPVSDTDARLTWVLERLRTKKYDTPLVLRQPASSGAIAEGLC
jgi:hypothetical protein